MMEHRPTGKREDDPIPVDDLFAALRLAKQWGEKFWFRLWSDTNHLYEVYPGGRNVAWPKAILDKRRERQAPLPYGHRCKHAWDTHTDCDPVAAGLHIEQWRQCLKCGQIREDWIQHAQAKR